MFKSDWLRTATGVGLVCGLSIMVGMLWLGLFLDEQSYQQIQKYCSTHPTQCDASKSQSVVSSSPLAEGQPIGGQPKWWERADLDAQRQMARWTTVIALFTMGGVVLLGWTLWETRNVAVETRRIGEAQARAVLDIKEVAFDRLFAIQEKMRILSNGGICVPFDAKIVNVGNSPAYDVQCVGRAYFTDSDMRLNFAANEDEWTGSDDSSKNFGFIPQGGERLAEFYPAPKIDWEFATPAAISEGQVFYIAISIAVTYHDDFTRNSGSKPRKTIIRRFVYTNTPDQVHPIKNGDEAT